MGGCNSYKLTNIPLLNKHLWELIVVCMAIKFIHNFLYIQHITWSGEQDKLLYPVKS